MENDYIPFGEEWEKELMHLNKKQLISLYRKSRVENKEGQLQDLISQVIESLKNASYHVSQKVALKLIYDELKNIYQKELLK